MSSSRRSFSETTPGLIRCPVIVRTDAPVGQTPVLRHGLPVTMCRRSVPLAEANVYFQAQ